MTDPQQAVARRIGPAPSAASRQAFAATVPIGPWFRRGATWLLALVWLVVVGAPLYYMIVASLQPASVYLSSNPWLPDKGLTLDNYREVFASGIGTYFVNSIIVTVSTTVLSVAISFLAGYAIVVHASRVTGVIFRVFLAGFAVPIQALMIPLYLTVLKTGLYDSLIGLILPMAAFSLPITILILVNFLREVPRSLIDAMRMDGAGAVRTLWSLALPLSWPAIATVGIFDFVNSWNNFLFPLILTQGQEKATLPLSVFNFEGQHLENVPEIMAAVALSVAPLFVLYLVARRKLMSGLAAGFAV